jgi:hypothetical protein
VYTSGGGFFIQRPAPGGGGGGEDCPSKDKAAAPRPPPRELFESRTPPPPPHGLRPNLPRFLVATAHGCTWQAEPPPLAPCPTELPELPSVAIAVPPQQQLPSPTPPTPPPTPPAPAAPPPPSPPPAASSLAAAVAAGTPWANGPPHASLGRMAMVAPPPLLAAVTPPRPAYAPQPLPVLPASPFMPTPPVAVAPPASLAYGGLPPQLFPSPWDARVAHFGGGGAPDGGWLAGAPMAPPPHAYGGPQGMQGMRLPPHAHAHPAFPADPFAHAAHPFGGPGGAYGTPLYMQGGYNMQGPSSWEPKPWEYARM